jgi:hypothetical protein
MIHRQSQDNASYHVRQHARMMISLLYLRFLFCGHRASPDAALNANGTI